MVLPRVFNPTGATTQERRGDSPDAKSRRLLSVTRSQLIAKGTARSQFKGPEEIGDGGLEASRRGVRLRGDMRCMRARECGECEEYKV